MFGQQKFQSEKAPQPTESWENQMKGISSQQWKSKPVSIRTKNIRKPSCPHGGQKSYSDFRQTY